MSPRGGIALALALALVVFGVATVTVLVDTEWHHYVDSSLYVLTAQSLDAGQGYTYHGQPFVLRPPGLAWVLSHVVGGAFDPEDARSLNLVIQGFAAATFLAVALAMRRLHGTLLGLLVALLFAINPTTIQGFNSIFSEFPQMAFFFAGAWLLLPARSEAGAPGRPVGWARGAAGALLLGCSLWFRTIGLLALPALVLAALTRPSSAGLAHPGGKDDAAGPQTPTDVAPPGRWRQAARAGVFAAVALAVVLPWLAHARTARAKLPRPVTQFVAFDHLTGLLHVDARDPDSPTLDLDDWRTRVATMTVDVSNGLAATFGGELRWARRREEASRELAAEEALTASWPARLLALFLAGCLAVTALTRRSFLDWYALLYAVLVLLWFTYVQRMLLPILPMLLSSVVHTCTLVGDWFDRRRPHGITVDVLTGLLAVVLGFASLATLSDTLTPGFRRADRTQRERDAARWVAGRAAPGDVLLAERGPVMALLTGHTTYTWRHLPGTWPNDCPPVDWAIYGPADKYPEVKAALRAAAQEEFALTRTDYRGQDETLWVFRLRRD